MNDSKKGSKASAAAVLGPEPADVVVKLSGVSMHVTGHAPSVVIAQVAASKEQAFGPGSPEWHSRSMKTFSEVHGDLIEQVRNGKWVMSRSLLNRAG